MTDPTRSPGAAPIPENPVPEDPVPDDPVVARRAVIQRWCDIGQRFGYLCFGASMVLFVVGFVMGFPTWVVTTIIVVLVAGSAVLLPAIILGYAAKAAEKEERGEPFGY